MNDYWLMEREFELKEAVLISLSGGRKDLQVSPTHTHTPLANLALTTNQVRMGRILIFFIELYNIVNKILSLCKYLLIHLL